jgi:hypothetical protein
MKPFPVIPESKNIISLFIFCMNYLSLVGILIIELRGLCKYPPLERNNICIKEKPLLT